MEHSSERKPKSGNNTNWIGILFFLLLFLGPQIGRILSSIISSITGGTVTLGTNAWPFIIGAFIVVMVVVALGRTIRHVSQRSETRLPTTLSPPMRTYQDISRPTSIPTQPDMLYRPPVPPANRSVRSLSQGLPWDTKYHNSDLSLQELPRTPQFEPIISGKVLAFGLVTLLAFGVVLGLFLVLLVI